MADIVHKKINRQLWLRLMEPKDSNVWTAQLLTGAKITLTIEEPNFFDIYPLSEFYTLSSFVFLVEITSLIDTNFMYLSESTTNKHYITKFISVKDYFSLKDFSFPSENKETKTTQNLLLPFNKSKKISVL